MKIENNEHKILAGIRITKPGTKNNFIVESEIGASPHCLNSYWICRDDGEGGNFPIKDVCNVLYDALEKYFLENH
jgi:hypothetical protein